MSTPGAAAAPTRHGNGTALVVLTGLALAAYLHLAVVAPPAARFAPPVRAARWLEAPDGAAVLYLRKELRLAAAPASAWLYAGATAGRIAIEVNGRRLAETASAERRPALLADLTPALVPGLNVLGIRIERMTGSGPARAVVEGEAVDRDGGTTAIVSDASWATLIAAGDRLPGWQSPSFGGGSPAVVGESPGPGELGHLLQPPALYREPPPSTWLASAEPGGRTARLSGAIPLESRPAAAWARIAAEGNYSLLVNGMRVADVAEAHPGTLDLHDIGPWLAHDANHIELRVLAAERPARAAVDLLLVARNGAVTRVAGERLLSAGLARVSAPGPEPRPRRAMPGGPSPELLRRRAVTALGLTLATLALVVAAWLGTARVAAHLDPTMIPGAARRELALLHVPTVLLLGTLLLASTDQRVDPRDLLQPGLAALALLLLWMLDAGWLLERWLRPGACEERPAPARRWRLELGLAAALGMLSLALRLHDLGAKPFYHDEVSMVLAARQVQAQSYPAREIGPIRKPLTTYELVPYPIALATALLGESEGSARLPAALFGALTTVLVSAIAFQLWSRGAGLLAGALHALSPLALLWGRTAFHPQQTQLLALLGAALIYRAVGEPGQPVRKLPLWLGALLLALTYLSWEGAGLLLPALLLGLAAARGRDLRHALGWHTLLASIAVAAVVVAQLANRTLANDPYLVVGRGLSTQSFTLAFLAPLYDPYFYLQGFLLLEPQILLTVAALAAAWLAWRDAALRFVVTVLASTLLLLTNLLANSSSRYAVFVLPLLILAAARGVEELVARLRALATEDHRLPTIVTRAVLALAAAALPFALVAASLPRVLEPRLPWDAALAPFSPDLIPVDYRGPARFVRAHAAPGDAVLAIMPHAFEYYSGLTVDGYLQPYTSRQVMYDALADTPAFMDRYTGSRVLRNREELEDLVRRHRRAWIVATPAPAFDRAIDPPTREFLEREATVVFESQGARVYRWGH